MVDYEIYEFTGSYFSFEGEKCQNMPFLGKKNLALVSTGTHGQR